MVPALVALYAMIFGFTRTAMIPASLLAVETAVERNRPVPLRGYQSWSLRPRKPMYLTR